MKKFSLLSIIFSFAFVYSQPTIQWQKTLGGANVDVAKSIQQTIDGGYIVAGYTTSTDGDVTGNQGSSDSWIVKLSNSGTIEWQECLGGSNWEYAQSIQQTTDGGYIVAGYSVSTDGDLAVNQGSTDIWVIKLSSSGIIEWQKTFGGTKSDIATSIQQTTDGGYIVAGETESNDGDVTGNHGSSDSWVLKLNSSGTIVWQKTFGGTEGDFASSIQQTTDGGYILLVGETYSNDGDVTGNHGGGDIWVVKLSSSGTIQWQKPLGGSRYDGARSIQQTTDGGYILAGDTTSNDGDVTGEDINYDIWVVQLNSSGTIVWQKIIGKPKGDYAFSIQQTTDGGYIVAAGTELTDGDLGEPYLYDIWVFKLNSSGTILWEKTLGGSKIDVAFSIQQTTDGGYILAGYTESNDGDVTGKHGSEDIWVVKLLNTLGINEVTADDILSIYPNPFANEINVKIDANSLGSLYSIYDQSGRTVLTGQLNTESSIIEISDLSKGIYVFRLGDKYKSIKIVKD
jgi:hypothetical protein